MEGRILPEPPSAGPRGVIGRFATNNKNRQNGLTPQSDRPSSQRKPLENHYAVSNCDYRQASEGVLEGDFVAIDCTGDTPYSAGLLQSLQEGVYAVSTIKHRDSADGKQKRSQPRPKEQRAGDEQLQHLLKLHQQQKQELQQERRSQQEPAPNRQQYGARSLTDVDQMAAVCNGHADTLEEQYMQMAPSGDLRATRANGDLNDNQCDYVNFQISNKEHNGVINLHSNYER